MDTTAGQQRLRFGAFELDRRAGELRRAGSRVPLQHQPFEVLCALLEYPGQVVTREELRSRVWRNGAYLDFDRGLNKAMVKLRDALHDAADAPRFIETLPRHGYRFIGEVAPELSPELPAIVVPEPILVEPEPIAPAARTHRAIWVAAAALAALGVIWFVQRPAPEPLRIVRYTQLSHAPLGRYSQLLSDGNALYYSELTGAQGTRVMRLPIGGGGEEALDLGLPDVRVWDLSPDGREFLGASVTPELRYADDYPLWILPLHGGAARRVGNLMAGYASWSHDGKRIYFASGHDLSVANPDGGDARVLINVKNDWIIKPHLSPDGTHLRYTVQHGFARATLWEAGSDGSAPHPIFSDGAFAQRNTCCGDWFGDGRDFVFQVDHGIRSEQWYRREAGVPFTADSTPSLLSSGALNLRGILPGAQAHTFYAIGIKDQGELMRYDGASGKWLPFLGGMSADGVIYSHDGAWIAYTSYPDASLWRMRADGSDKRQLTQPPFEAGLPEFSPNGRQLSFMGREDAVHPWQVYLLSPDGGMPQVLWPEAVDQFGGDWSPDGTRIALGYITTNMQALHVIDVASRKRNTVPHSQGLCCAEFLADGTHLLAFAGSPQRLVVVDIASGARREIYRGAINSFTPSYDRLQLIVDTGDQENAQMLRMPLDGSAPPERIANLEGMHRAYAAFGAWMGTDNADAPMVLRDTSSSEIYALTLGH